MNLERMSDEGAVKTLNEICDGLKEWVKHNPDDAKELLVVLVPECLEMLAQDDFFGTEGWQQGLSVNV